MAPHRFRNDGELLVLQVFVPPKTGQYGYGREGEWRDARVTDFDASQLIGPLRVSQDVEPPDPFYGQGYR